MVAVAVAAWSPTVASAADAASLYASDSSSSLRLGALPARQATITTIPVRVHGDLAVDFHGDRATGCAARGLCGFSGTADLAAAA
jgi:poly(3-hydroxybutyrate) depolymerase